MLAGSNGAGKTTVLEALRVYAARGGVEALREVLSGREELTTSYDEEGKRQSYPALDRLFHHTGSGRTATIGPVANGPRLKIDVVAKLDFPEDLIDGSGDLGEALRVSFDGVCSFHLWERSNPWGLWRYRSSPDAERTVAPMRCQSLGPRPLGSGRLAALWDDVALTDGETLSLEALRLVFGDRVAGVAAIGDEGQRHGRRMMAKLVDQSKPVPLSSLGGGAIRMFGVALALAHCRDGILLIDEAENGIRYTLQRAFWIMVLYAAQLGNTQVVATTQSKDCINGFTAAALACPNIDGNLVRLGWHNRKLRAVDYSMEELQTAAEQNIEVR